jgi:hypothetical protein
VPETTRDETDDPMDRELQELLHTERHRAHVDERRRRNRLRRQADESLALRDVLGALAAHGTVVTVHARHGEVPPSTVGEVGRDFVALHGPGAVARFLPAAAIVAIRPVAPPWATSTPVGGRPGPDLDLGERLRELAGQRSSATIVAGRQRVQGRLRRVGFDLVVVEQAGGSDAYVSLDAVDEVQIVP